MTVTGLITRTNYASAARLSAKIRGNFPRTDFLTAFPFSTKNFRRKNFPPRPCPVARRRHVRRRRDEASPFREKPALVRIDFAADDTIKIANEQPAFLLRDGTPTRWQKGK
jgi:hypothetical protein